MLYGLLAVIIILLSIKIYLLKRSAREISDSFADRLHTDTNTPIGISSRDKDMIYLADSINTQLKVLRREHHKYTVGDRELKTAIINISHDIRTPLTAISGYLDIMKEMDKSEEIEKYLDILEERSAVMKQLTEEMFSYSVALSDGVNKDKTEFSVNQLLEDTIIGYYGAISEKGIEPVIEISSNKQLRTLNRSSLGRVFSNLINNAIRYSDGDLSIKMNDEGTIFFSNSASSLTTVQVEKLFDRFYTVESSRNSTGLGLAIARTLLEQMNGTIKAEFDNGILTFVVNI
ncbi:MAG: HAMP domain-containing histidine kinase [Ruminococcus sp.]|nr:HAMP domain-containing histidine kinase [Ruminococcus sp.]